MLFDKEVILKTMQEIGLRSGCSKLDDTLRTIELVNYDQAWINEFLEA